MKKISFISFLLCCIVACHSSNHYDPSYYYDAPQQDSLLTSIVTYLFEAPLGTNLKDRFESQHRDFYSSKSAMFSLMKLYIADDGTHYFYVLRPGYGPQEKRAVGGHFKIKNKNQFELMDFREEFVTTLKSEVDLKTTAAFLFDDMVKGNLGPDLKMESYIQWPNAITVYDTATYSWKLKPGFDNK